MSFLPFVLLFTLLAPAPKGIVGSKGDWPQWRGPNRDGHSGSTGLLKTWPKDGPKLLWSFDTTGVGYGSPAVGNGRIFILGSDDPDKGTDEHLLCLTEKDGKEVWRKPLNTEMGDYNYGWGSGPRSTPTIDGDQVYILGAKGELISFNAADGKINWSKSLVKDFEGKIPVWGYSESLLIDGNNLLVTPGGSKGALVALNKKTGETLWRCTDIKDAAGYSSVIVAEVGGIRQYIQQSMNQVFGVSAKDGKLLWKRADIKYAVAVIPTPIFIKDHVFVTSGYNAGCSLIKLSKDGDGIKADKVYANHAIVNHHGGVIQVGDYIYGHSDKGNNWVCLEFMKDNGEEGPEPTWRSNKLDKGSIGYADGYLYCYGQSKGECVKIEATSDEWKESGRFTVPKKSKFPRRSGMIWAHPVIANGVLYLRDHEILFAFDVSGSK
jgi:outer membrane protein assembly factor BamB